MDTVLRFWPLLIALVTLAGTAGAGRYALGVVIRRLDALSAKLDDTNKCVAAMSTTVAVQATQLAAHTEQDRLQFHNIEQRLERIAQ